MAEPPRLPAIRLPWEKLIIYFVTICVKNRQKVLATPEVFEAIKTAIPQPQKWHVLADVEKAGDCPYSFDFVNGFPDGEAVSFPYRSRASEDNEAGWD